jgi:hypothetical protein
MTALPTVGATWSNRLIRVAVAAILAGCATANPTPPPAPSGSAVVATAGPVGSSPTAPPTTAPASTDSATHEPTVASPSAATTANGWTAVPSQASVLNVQFRDVVWTGKRFVAVATGHEDSGAFLDSTDGLTWHLQPNPTKGFPSDVAVGPHGLVAIGTIGDRLASWASADGLTWTSHAGGFPVPTTGPDVISVTSVVATDDGWLAVGRRDGICSLNCGIAPVSAIVWTSTDGLRWTRVPDQAAFSKAAITSVTRLGSTFVAVGLAVRRAVVWTSTNGTTWTRVPDAPLFHPRSSTPGSWIQMTGVTAGNGIVVAIGMDAASLCQDACGRSVRAWWSTDGKTWTKGTGDSFAEGQAFSVNATPSGFIATGPSGSDSCNGGIWTSPDGRAWSCVASDAGFDGFAPYAAAGSPSVEVVVGLGNGEGASDGEPGAAWWRPVP